MNGWQAAARPTSGKPRGGQDLLSSHYPRYIDPATDAKLRERFPDPAEAGGYANGSGRR